MAPKVRVFTTRICVFCVRAKLLLQRQEIPFEEVDVSDDDEARMRLVRESGGRRTVPVIFIGDRCVGGYQELKELDRSGELQALLTGP